MEAQKYLLSIMPSRDEVRAFVDPGADDTNGWTFDAELGWVHCDASHKDGVDGSRTYYHYEADGARKVVNFPERPCRIHTYGNSFTHCDQVSDGETWQEYLAGHFQEPVRNYGVGGYSVYQAYRRMLRTEKQTPAEYIILNIWSDNHFRNIDAWRSIRFGRRSRCGYPLPHLLVDVERNCCEQVENIFRSPEDVLLLCDEDFVARTFENDRVLKTMISAGTDLDTARTLVCPVQVSVGIPEEKIPDPSAAHRLVEQHTQAALFATQNVISWTEKFVNRTGKKLIVLLSYSQQLLAADLAGEPRFDQSFVDWIRTRPFPVIDLRNAFGRDFADSQLDVNTYLRWYYNGHHSPAGNFFTAWAIKDALIEWLDPVPLPYR